MRKTKLLITGSGGFIFGNFIRQVFYHKKPYIISSLDKVRDSHIIHNIYVNQDHQFYIADIVDSHILHVIFEKERPDIVIHGAAESAVDKSINNTLPFTTSNVVGTQNVIDQCLKHNSRLIYMSCYDEKTRAVTKSGLKSFSEINVGDIVLSINPSTGFLEEKEVQKVIIQDYEGEMVKFYSDSVNLLTTPNHRFLVDNGKEFFWTTAEDLEKNTDVLYFPYSTIESEHNHENIDIPGIGLVNTDILFYVCGVFIGDGFIGDCENSSNPYLGYALNTLNIKYTSTQDEQGECIYFTSKHWNDFFIQFGTTENKHIPNWIFNYKSHLFRLWKGISDSSNYAFGVKSNSITTLSQDLVSDLLYLGHMIGLSVYYEKFSNNIIENDIYRVSFNQKKLRIPETSREFYSGKIWCLTVQDNKNFLVEREGKLLFSGNTDEVYGALPNDQSPPWNETSPLNPRNTYSATKASGELLIKAVANTHGLKYNIIRSSNNYGPWQTTEKFIPRVIDRILSGKEIPIYGTGNQIRDWVHVFDTCSAIFKIIDSAPNTEIYNITAKQEFMNIEVAQIICNTLGKGYELITHVEDRLGHDFRYAITNDKIKGLGWVPEYKFRDGIVHTCQWYVNNKFALQL